MCAVDPNAPTDEENELTAISKYRYMSFRESLTSTVNLGFRIEGIKVSDVSFISITHMSIFLFSSTILFYIFYINLYISLSKSTEGVSKDFKTLRDKDKIIECILEFSRFDRNILVSLKLLNTYAFFLELLFRISTSVGYKISLLG